jgi:hypothetical protein
VKKKNTGKIRVCIDFRNLNRAMLKDEYPMPMADVLVNSALGNRIKSFLDGNAGYNQIFMAKEDASKTTFRCLGFVGLFEWVVKSSGFDAHLANLHVAFERMRKYGLKMNPLKCAFGVIAGKFLGFVVHEQGMEIDPKKIESIKRVEEPTYKKDVQKLLGKINSYEDSYQI